MSRSFRFCPFCGNALNVIGLCPMGCGTEDAHLCPPVTDEHPHLRLLTDEGEFVEDDVAPGPEEEQ